ITIAQHSGFMREDVCCRRIEETKLLHKSAKKLAWGQETLIICRRTDGVSGLEQAFRDPQYCIVHTFIKRFLQSTPIKSASCARDPEKREYRLSQDKMKQSPQGSSLKS